MQGQFEQQLNGYLLEKKGYGKNVREIYDDVVGEFLYAIPRYEQCFEDHQPTNNQAIQEKLDELLENNAALAVDFQSNRT